MENTEPSRISKTNNKLVSLSTNIFESDIVDINGRDRQILPPLIGRDVRTSMLCDDLKKINNHLKDICNTVLNESENQKQYEESKIDQNGVENVLSNKNSHEDTSSQDQTMSINDEDKFSLDEKTFTDYDDVFKNHIEDKIKELENLRLIFLDLKKSISNSCNIILKDDSELLVLSNKQLDNEQVRLQTQLYQLTTGTSENQKCLEELKEKSIIISSYIHDQIQKFDTHVEELNNKNQDLSDEVLNFLFERAKFSNIDCFELIKIYRAYKENEINKMLNRHNDKKTRELLDVTVKSNREFEEPSDSVEKRKKENLSFMLSIINAKKYKKNLQIKKKNNDIKEENIDMSKEEGSAIKRNRLLSNDKEDTNKNLLLNFNGNQLIKTTEKKI
uniref:Coiled-coil domain-containing protein n=1 Tax=Parastrongyloides trichosuri TaxID=131310 RepID=A0A0N4Z339_PARTI